MKPAGFLKDWSSKAKDELIGRPIVNEIVHRLQFLAKVGVAYLTLDRSADTLSGGEMQRVRLASSIGSGLVGVCYILDEPSIGLHPRDNERLIQSLRDLQRLGNTVIVVEHDEATMREADQIIDVGPGAGQNGGNVVAQGTPTEVQADTASVTGQYLVGEKRIAIPEKRRKVKARKQISLERATTNNLKNVTLKIPLETFVCVTGVSGSGKSSLVNETLARAITRHLGNKCPKPGSFSELKEWVISINWCRSRRLRLDVRREVMRLRIQEYLMRFARCFPKHGTRNNEVTKRIGLALM